MIANDRSPVPTQEIDSLVRRYAGLRGAAPVRRRSAGEWAQVAQIGDDVDDALAEQPANWAVQAGALHAQNPLSEAPLTELDGQFAVVRYRADTDAIEAFSDPFGMQQFYWAERANRTYISTSATVLAAHLNAPANADGAKLYVRTGKQLGPITLWRGVERFDPAMVFTFAPEGRTRATYWRPVVDPAVRRMSFSRTADFVTEVCIAAGERQLGGTSCRWADLTGGYDSRLTTALLARVGLQFRANTSGEAETADVRIAREVASAGGLQWQHERLPTGWRLEREELDEAVGWADGTLDVLPLTEILWRQRERRRVCPVVVNGGGGEHFGPAPWMQEFVRAGRSREVNLDNFMRMRMLPPVSGAGVWRAGLADEVESFCREYSLDVFARRTEPYSAELNTSKLDMMYVYRAISHFGAFRSAFDAHVRTELPFYFKDVFSAGFSANHRWRNGHRLHRGVIERLSPELSAVATERGGPAQGFRVSNAHRFLPYYTGLGRVAVRKIRGRSAPSSGLPASQATAYAQSVQELRAEGVLDARSMRTGSLYDAQALEDLVSRAGLPGFTSWAQLGRIATVELTLRKTEATL